MLILLLVLVRAIRYALLVLVLVFRLAPLAI